MTSKPASPARTFARLPATGLNEQCGKRALARASPFSSASRPRTRCAPSNQAKPQKNPVPHPISRNEASASGGSARRSSSSRSRPRSCSLSFAEAASCIFFSLSGQTRTPPGVPGAASGAGQPQAAFEEFRYTSSPQSTTFPRHRAAGKKRMHAPGASEMREKCSCRRALPARAQDAGFPQGVNDNTRTFLSFCAEGLPEPLFRTARAARRQMPATPRQAQKNPLHWSHRGGGTRHRACCILSRFSPAEPSPRRAARSESPRPNERVMRCPLVSFLSASAAQPGFLPTCTSRRPYAVQL